MTTRMRVTLPDGDILLSRWVLVRKGEIAFDGDTIMRENVVQVVVPEEHRWPSLRWMFIPWDGIRWEGKPWPLRVRLRWPWHVQQLAGCGCAKRPLSAWLKLKQSFSRRWKAARSGA